MKISSVIIPSLFCATSIFLLFSCNSLEKKNITWKMNSTEEIGGNEVTLKGNPILREDGIMEFDGRKDGILVNSNPISGMENFTIEVEIKPYSGFPENREQRFLHIQDPGNENRRILLELRLNDREEWYGDWFIKSEENSITLLDSTRTHPVNQWYTMALTYSNGKVQGSVNGKQEVEGEINFLPVGENGKVSLGTRMDERSWYKGAIREVRFKPEYQN